MPLSSLTKPDYTTQDASTYKANIDNIIDDIVDNNDAGVALETPPLVYAPLMNSMGFFGAGALSFTRSHPWMVKNRYGRAVQHSEDDPVFGEHGLRIRTSNGNQVQRSENMYLETTYWLLTNVLTSRPASPDDPLGNPARAMRVNDQTATGNHGVQSNFANSPASQCTASIFLRDETRQYVRMSLWNATDGHLSTTYFDLSAGTKVSGPGSIEDYGNGWYRCRVTATPTVTGSEISVFMSPDGTSANYTGSNKTINMWGGMIEAGANLGDYIYTPDSGGTENSEAEEVTLTYEGNFDATAAFTIAVDVVRDSYNSTNNQTVLHMDGNGPLIEFASAASGRLDVTYNSTTIQTTGWSVTTKERCVVVHDGTNLKVYRDGVQVGTSAISLLTAHPTIINLGWDGTADQLLGSISNLRLFDFGLSVRQVEAL